MAIRIHDLTDADLGRIVEHIPAHDPTRPPERGLLAGWDGRHVVIRFWSGVLGGYRPAGYAVLPDGVRFVEEVDA